MLADVYVSKDFNWSEERRSLAKHPSMTGLGGRLPNVWPPRNLMQDLLWYDHDRLAYCHALNECYDEHARRRLQLRNNIKRTDQTDMARWIEKAVVEAVEAVEDLKWMDVVTLADDVE
jgi:hypothetical protein